MGENQPKTAAKKSDWKTEEMPRQHTCFSIKRKMSDAELANLKLGNIPQAMEDKWFWYFENGRLYVHRSWTGFCIYILEFYPELDLIKVVANRDPEQYKCADDEEDAKQLNKLLDWWTKDSYDYYHEWLSETLDNIKKQEYAVTTDVLMIGGAERKAVYFHKPEEPNGFLSNWYKSEFELDGMKFSSVEQYIMYRKCMTFGDLARAQAVMDTDDTEEQQAIARKAAGYNDAVWNGLRQPIAMRALVAKFDQSEDLCEALRKTGDACLVECAGSDRIWACGVRLNDPARKDIKNWKGRNILGFALMEVRKMLFGDIKPETKAAEPEYPNKIYINLDDITTMDCDAIVNAANKSLLGGGGVDGAIHRAAGPKLLEECRKLGGCKTGEAKITKAYDLDVMYVIHTVGPIYSGKPEDAVMLANCYRNSLNLAKEHSIHSIAFPAISTGVYGYLLDEAVPIAMDTATDWIHDNEEYGMEIIFCCYDQRTYDLYQEYAQEAGI